MSLVLYAIFRETKHRDTVEVGELLVRGTKVTLLLFADDVVLFTSLQGDLRHTVKRFTAVCEVVSMPPPQVSSRSPPKEELQRAAPGTMISMGSAALPR